MFWSTMWNDSIRLINKCITSYSHHFCHENTWCALSTFWEYNISLVMITMCIIDFLNLFLLIFHFLTNNSQTFHSCPLPTNFPSLWQATLYSLLLFGSTLLKSLAFPSVKWETKLGWRAVLRREAGCSSYVETFTMVGLVRRLKGEEREKNQRDKLKAYLSNPHCGW